MRYPHRNFSFKGVVYLVIRYPLPVILLSHLNVKLLYHLITRNHLHSPIRFISIYIFPLLLLYQLVPPSLLSINHNVIENVVPISVLVSNALGFMIDYDAVQNVLPISVPISKILGFGLYKFSQ